MKWYEKHRGSITDIICFLFVLLFVYVAFSKLLEGQKFYDKPNNLFVFGVKYVAGMLFWPIPALEIGIALLLTLQRTRHKDLYGALALMVIFTVYVSGLLFSPYTSCLCGGVITLLSWNQYFVFSMVWIGLSLTAIVLLRSEHKEISHKITFIWINFLKIFCCNRIREEEAENLALRSRQYINY